MQLTVKLGCGGGEGDHIVVNVQTEGRREGGGGARGGGAWTGARVLHRASGLIATWKMMMWTLIWQCSGRCCLRAEGRMANHSECPLP